MRIVRNIAVVAGAFVLASIGLTIAAGIIVAIGSETEGPDFAAETTTTTEASTTDPTEAPPNPATTTTSTTAAPATTTTAAPATTTTFVMDQETAEMLYLIVVRGQVEPQYPEVAGIDDESLITMGYQICDIVTVAKADGDPADETMLWLFATTVDAFSYDQDLGATLVGSGLGAATAGFCPEHEDYVIAMIEATQ